MIAIPILLLGVGTLFIVFNRGIGETKKKMDAEWGVGQMPASSYTALARILGIVMVVIGVVFLAVQLFGK